MIIKEEDHLEISKIEFGKNQNQKNQSRKNQSHKIQVQEQCLTSSNPCIDWATVVLNDHSINKTFNKLKKNQKNSKSEFHGKLSKSTDLK